MNPIQLFQALKNPQQFLANIASNPQINNNPMAQSAISMYQKGDNKGLEQLARNICQSKGINPDELMNQLGMYK